MKSTFRWLGLVAMPLRLMLAGIIIIAFGMPAILNWSTVNLPNIVIILVLTLAGFFLLLGLFTRFSASLILIIALLKLLAPAFIIFRFEHEWLLWALIMVSSFVIFITGGGTYSLDHLIARNQKIYASNWFRQMAGGDIPLPPKQLKILTIVVSALFIGVMTFRAFADFKEISGSTEEMKVLQADSIIMEDNSISFNLSYLNSQATKDTIYLLYIKLFAEDNEPVAMWNNLNFQIIGPNQITNFQGERIKAGPHSLQVASGAQGRLTFFSPELRYFKSGLFQLHLEDVSGHHWMFEFQVNQNP